MEPPIPVDLSGMSDGIWDERYADHVTLSGAEWLASAAPSPASVQARWAAGPTEPAVLPCGTVFDVVNLPSLFGRRVLDRLWSAGPGCGPAAAYRGRTLLFAAPGTADRLPALLAWEEWGSRVPRMLCYGRGDTVTVPPLIPGPGPARWLIAPDGPHPWLPGPGELLWACLRAARSRPPLNRPAP